jgi:hypothetical protein
VYSHGYPTFGNLDDLCTCIDYLQDKPKFFKWRAEMEKVEKGTKKSGLTGKKVVQQEKANEKLVAEVIAKAMVETNCSSADLTSGRDKLYEMIFPVVDKVAATLLSKMDEENEALLANGECLFPC